MDTAYGPFRLRLFWRVLLRLLLGPGQLSALCNCMASAQVQRRQRCWRAARPAGPSCWARPLAKGMLRCLGHAKRNLRAVRRRLCTDIVCPLSCAPNERLVGYRTVVGTDHGGPGPLQTARTADPDARAETERSRRRYITAARAAKGWSVAACALLRGRHSTNSDPPRWSRCGSPRTHTPHTW